MKPSLRVLDQNGPVTWLASAKRLFFGGLLASASCFAGYPGQAQAAAIGNIDSAVNGSISGWTLDTASSGATTNVQVFLDGPKGEGKQLATIPTNNYRSDVNSAQHATGNHGFTWTIPTSVKSTLHILFVYGVGVDGNVALLANGPVAYPPVSVATIGPSQGVVIYQTSACEQFDIPDHPARAFRTADGNVNLIASHINARRAVGPTLDSVKHNCAVIHSSAADPSFFDFNYFQWLQAPYTLDGNTIYNVMHNEWYANLVDSACQGDLIDGWISAITFSVSRDRGATFIQPANYVIRNPTTPWNNSFPCSSSAATRYGDLGGSNIIHKGAFYYKFFQYETEPGVTPSGAWQCVMRASNLENSLSWQIWTGAGWITSKTAPCAKVPVIVNVRSVTYNTYLHMYVAIQWYQPKGMVFNLSADLLNWSAPTYIRMPGFDASTTPYPSLLDPSDKSLNFENSSRLPYLYYTQLHNGINGDLMRIPLRLSVSFGP